VNRITTAELARNLPAVLDHIRESGETCVVECGGQPMVQISPMAGRQNAEQALADLYRGLASESAAGWREDAQRGREDLDGVLRDPWAS
jgi:antitoxin (DNA-binding transcriptional repressor) of toxin-antitoxin stability system